MVDDLKNRGPAERARINLNEDREVTWWCKKWSITPTQLNDAVKKVGVSAAAVAMHLGKTL